VLFAGGGGGGGRALRITRADSDHAAPAHGAGIAAQHVGIPLPYIRDILGHVDLSTTEIYARASTEAKRKALEAAYTDVVTTDLPEWNQNPELLNWLTGL
jgi:integrase/recombinase XerD